MAAVGINSIVSAFYYFRVLRAMYLEPAGNLGAFMGHPLGVAVSAGSAVMLVVMLVLASPVNRLTRSYAKIGASAAATRPTMTASAHAP